MDKYELYAKEKELEKEAYRIAAVRLYRKGEMNLQTLNHVIDKSFALGHNAGHCRGEGYKNRLQEEII